MQATIADDIDALIDAYDLHATIPVRLDAIEPLYVPERLNLDELGVAGMVILPKGGMVSPTNFARILLSDALSPFMERLVYAHEVAHAIIGHPGELRFAGMDRWFVDKAERQAWEVASRLLIPHRAIVEREDVDSIARYCQVPSELVRMAWS